MIGSDSFPLARGRPHPRTYGTFPRVLARHELIPEGPMRIVLDQHEIEIDELGNLSGDRLGQRHRLLQPARSGSAWCRPRRGQHHLTIALERAQRFQTARALSASPGVDETEVGTDSIRQRGAVRLGHLAHQRLHARQALRRAQRALDLALCSHLGHSSGPRCICPASDVGIGQG